MHTRFHGHFEFYQSRRRTIKRACFGLLVSLFHNNNNNFYRSIIINSIRKSPRKHQQQQQQYRQQEKQQQQLCFHTVMEEAYISTTLEWDDACLLLGHFTQIWIRTNLIVIIFGATIAGITSKGNEKSCVSIIAVIARRCR